MPIDLNEYRYLVDRFQGTDTAKAELLGILSQIALHFVDLAWGAESTQLCIGRRPDDEGLPDIDEPDPYAGSLTGNFKQKARKGRAERTDE